jgi:type II secretory pathway pseudopilin PulG
MMPRLSFNAETQRREYREEGGRKKEEVIFNAKTQRRRDAENELRTPNAERFVSPRHRVNPLFPCVSASLRLCVKNFSFLLPPSSFLPPFASPRLCASALKNPRRGATLLVTLGILTVLSVMAVTFLVATRLQQQTAVSRGQRLAARNQLNEALHLAMRTVEDAFCTTNFADATPPPDPPVPQRLTPVGRWFSEEWENRRGELSDDFSYQAPGVLTVPVSNHTAALQAAWSVNLFTPEVLALVPPALTNGLPLSASDTRPLRSGWELIDAPALDRTGTRIAFAVFDVSGFLDANYFITGPTTQKLPRICFSQADVTNWVAHVDHEKIKNLKLKIPDLGSEPDRVPFSSLSYDPNPDADPFMPGSTVPHPYLGYDSFSRLHTNKVALGTLTNFLSGASERDTRDRIFPVNFWLDWFFPVLRAVKRTAVDEPIEHPEPPMRYKS